MSRTVFGERTTTESATALSFRRTSGSCASFTEASIAVGAVIDLVAAVVGIAEEEALCLADVVIHAAELVAEVILAEIRAGDEVVRDRGRGAGVRRRVGIGSALADGVEPLR